MCTRHAAQYKKARVKPATNGDGQGPETGKKFVWPYFPFNFGCNFVEHNHTPKWNENGDWNATGNCIPSANYQV